LCLSGFLLEWISEKHIELRDQVAQALDLVQSHKVSGSHKMGVSLWVTRKYSMWKNFLNSEVVTAENVWCSFFTYWFFEPHFVSVGWRSFMTTSLA
jgi:hypothetical protein